MPRLPQLPFNPIQAFGAIANPGQIPGAIGSGIIGTGMDVLSGKNPLQGIDDFPQQAQQRGILGTDVGEQLFPGANEALQSTAQPFKVGGPLGWQIGQPFPGQQSGQVIEPGPAINSGLQQIANQTVPNPEESRNFLGGPSPLTEAKNVVHSTAIFGQGVGNLLNDEPNIENDLVDSFRQGLSPSGSTLNPFNDAQSKKALNDLYDASGRVSNDIFDPKLMHSFIRDRMVYQGANEQDASNAADALAQPLSNLAMYATPGPVGKAMLLMFISQFVTDPGGTWNEIRKSGSDFTDLLGATANHVFRNGPTPNPNQISSGLNGLANTLGVLAMTHSVAGHAIGKTGDLFISQSNRIRDKALGQESPASDISDAIGKSAMSQPTEQTQDPNTINFGRTLQSRAALQSAAANAGKMSNNEFASDAEDHGAQVHGPEVPPEQRGRTGFILNDGRYVELPNYQDGYRNHERLLQDVGYYDAESGVSGVTQTARFLRDTGAIKETSGTEYSTYGFNAGKSDKIVEALQPYKFMRDAGVYIDDVKAGKSYSTTIGELIDHGWNLQETLKSPETRIYPIQGVDDYGPEDLKQAPQATETSPAGQANQGNQTDQAGTTQAAGGANQTGQGAGIVAEGNTNQGIQGENLPESNAKSIPAQLEFTGEHAQGMPDAIKNGMSQMLIDHGINTDGYINKVDVRTHDDNAYGYWDPAQDPRTIHLDLTKMGGQAPASEVSVLRRDLIARRNDLTSRLREARTITELKGLGLTPDGVRVAFDSAESAISDASKKLTPDNMIKWITAHEALHATLGRIFDYPPNGVKIESLGSEGATYRIPAAVHMISHMDSTPEGRAWLDHTATQMGLKGEVGQLRMLAKAVGDLRGDKLTNFVNSLPDVQKNKIELAHQFVDEALVHAILTGKDLSPYPYLLYSGEKAHANSFYKPQETQENARLATKYYDTYRSQVVPSATAEPRLYGSTGLQAGDRAAARYSRRIPDDQTRLEVIDQWRKSLEDTNRQIEEIASGKKISNPSLTGQLRINSSILASRLKQIEENPDKSLEQIIRSADAEAKTNHAQLFNHPAPKTEKPQALTEENAKQVVENIQKQRQSRNVKRQRTLAEISSITPAPMHYSDSRLTDEDRNKLARHVVGKLNSYQRRINAAEARGDHNTVLALSTKRAVEAAVWNKFFEERAKPEDFKITKSPKATDYMQEANKVVSYSSQHNLAPLKDLASSLIKSSQTFDEAKASGVNAAELSALQAKMQFDMTRFRFAHELYSSKVFRDNIDKQAFSWKGTRDIARRVTATDATPPEKARMAARLIGEKVLKRSPSNPYTLHEAGNDIRKTAMGLSKVAKNWHPEVKKLLAGEMWRVARQAWNEDPSLPMGVKNIPVHDMIALPSIEDLKSQISNLQSGYNDQLKQFKMQRDKANTLESSGRLPRGTVDRMDKEQKQKNLQFSNERLKIQSTIDNHALTELTRAVNHYLMTKEDIEAASNPSAERAIEVIGDNPSADKPISQLIDEAEALNERLKLASPNPFSLDSFLDEGKSEETLVNENGGGEPPDGTGMPPNNGNPWFSDDWSKALTDMREMGGNAKLVADLTDNLLKEMGAHIDPSRGLFHPMQWFAAHWSRLAGIPYRVHQIENALTQLVQDTSYKLKDPNVSKDILRAIDDVDDVHMLRELGTLSEDQAKIATFLNQYWKTTREVFRDVRLGPDPLISNFVDNYVPHVVLEDPDGNKLFDEKKQTWSRKSDFARKRVESSITGEPIFRQLQDLENRGYKVSWDISNIFAAHANSTFRMMQLRELMNTLKGTIYESPDGMFKGFPIVSVVADKSGRTQLDRMKMNSADYHGLEVFDKPNAKVRFGPGGSMLEHYRVHPELARYIERLASMKDVDLPGMAPARFLRSLGAIFKFVQFSINPRHAFNIYSNIANMSSGFGVLDPRVFRTIYGRANRAMLPIDRSRIYRLSHDRIRTAQEYRASLDKSARIEKQMRSLFEAMQEAGFDPTDPMPVSMDAKEADLRDEYDSLKQQLVDEHKIIDDALATRDRELLATLMGKGLVQDHDLIQSADLNALSNYAEKVPGMAQFHRWMWRDVVWRGQIGVAMHLADQFMMKAAGSHGWDGAGGITEAEKFVPEDLKDAIHREAVYNAKQATGLLNKLDMSTNWQVYGRATLISAPWTLGQLQASRDAFGNNALTRKLGRQNFTNISDRQLQSGFTKDKAMFLDNMHTKLARRMVYAGTAKLAMTSMFLSTIGSYLLTNQIQTPVQNFFIDPMHTFDIYAGRDPATGHVIWIDNPFYGFQHELVNYVMAGLKAGMEGKAPYQVGWAPIVRFLNKDNPMMNLIIDMATGQEMGRWLAGYDASMKNDTDLQNLHRAFDVLGAPDFGDNEDRALYLLRVIAPSPGGFAQTAIKRDNSGKPILDEQGNQIPLTDLRSMLNDFGIGGFINPVLDAGKAAAIPMSPDNAELSNDSSSVFSNLGSDVLNPRLGLFAAGSSEVESVPMYDPQVSLSGVKMQQDPTGFFPEEAQRVKSAETHQQTVARDMAELEIGNLAAQGTPEAYARIGQIRDQQGLTDSQVVNAILHKTVSQNQQGQYKTSQGLLGTRQPANGIVTINGTELSESQSSQYNKMKNNRQLYTIQKLQNSAIFSSADSSTKTIMVNELMNLSDKFNTAQAGQQFLNTGGPNLTDKDFSDLMDRALLSMNDVQNTVQLTDEYKNADPVERLKMLQSYISMSDTVSWNRQFGNLKGLDDTRQQALIMNSVLSEQEAQSYLKQTPFYQAADSQERVSMEKSYTALSRQMNMNIYSGKSVGMNPVEVPEYIHAVVNTEETAKYLLHQSDFYQNASLQDQGKLDKKYENYSRQLALRDWHNGNPLLNLGDASNAYNTGPEQLIVGHILAEQGYSDLQDQFGGAKTISAYESQLSDIKKSIKENVVASPSQISRMQTIITRNYENANPDYGNFIKARTAWERGSQIGRLYAALGADEQALAGVDTSVIADSTGINVGNDLTQAVDDSLLVSQDFTDQSIDPSLVDPSQQIVTDPNSMG